MTSINGEWVLRAGYEAFNRDDIDELMRFFAHYAVIRQVAGNKMYRGRDEIRGYLSSLDVYVDGALIRKIQIDAAPQMIHQMRLAAMCFEVVYILSGVYVRTFPGLKGRADAHGDEVYVSVRETVWINDRGKIIHIDQRLDLPALQ